MQLLNNSIKTLEYGRDIQKQKTLIQEILEDKEIKSFTANLTRTKNHIIDSDSVLHDAIISFLRTIIKSEFAFKSSPKAYLKTIIKNTFFAALRKKNIQVQSNEFDGLELESYNYQVELYNKEKQSIVNNLLNKVTRDCKEILELWALNFKLKEITLKLKYNSDIYLKKKKKVCLKKLRAWLNNNPKFSQELKDYV